MSPQFETRAMLVVVDPTMRWPNISVSAVVQMGGPAGAPTSHEAIVSPQTIEAIRGTRDFARIRIQNGTNASAAARAPPPAGNRTRADPPMGPPPCGTVLF